VAVIRRELPVAIKRRTTEHRVHSAHRIVHDLRDIRHLSQLRHRRNLRDRRHLGHRREWGHWRDPRRYLRWPLLLGLWLEWLRRCILNMAECIGICTVIWIWMLIFIFISMWIRMPIRMLIGGIGSEGTL